METQTSSNKKTTQKVAVIGAGAAGLVAARELQREGHQVVVLERNSRAGGVWVYDPNVESDPLSIDPSRTIVHTSLYDSLRINLPRELMGFRDYPFVVKEGDNRDPRRFPSHTEVLHYLQDFMTEFRLTELIRFETELVHVKYIAEGKCAVTSRHKHMNTDLEEVYNAVVICNGHYATPQVADIPGIDAWPGKQMHSHNYRVPDPFNNKVVVLIGASVSARDISRDIARVAKEVHVASRSNTNKIPTKQLGCTNLWLHSMIKSAHEDGNIIFHDDSSVLVDVIVHCTGYKYNFPFLDTGNIVTVDDNRVRPLYQHVFPPQFAPWISFIGVPSFKHIPFVLFELQSKWVAGILSGKISLPSPEEMISDINIFYSKLEANGVPKHYTHDIYGYLFEHYDWLAAQCQFPATEEWRKLMFGAALMNFVARPENYCDEWVDQDLILQAHQDFLHYFP